MDLELLKSIIEPPVGTPSKPIMVSLNFFRGTQKPAAPPTCTDLVSPSPNSSTNSASDIPSSSSYIPGIGVSPDTENTFEPLESAVPSSWNFWDPTLHIINE